MKKKVLSFALALVMCLGLTVPTFASGGFGGGGEGGGDVWSTFSDEPLEDMTFSVDPIGIVRIQFMKEDGSQGPTVTAYMFDQPASVSMKNGSTCDLIVWYNWWNNPSEIGEALYESYFGVDSPEFSSNIDVDFDGLYRFIFQGEPIDGEQIDNLTPYMVGKSYVDKLIAEGRHKVDIQPYTASQPTTPTQPETPVQPEQPSQPSVPNVPDAPGSYTVKKGDTWSSICTNFYGDNSQRYALMKTNKNVKLKEGAVIALPEKLGKAILLPVPVAGNGEKLYTVKAGDTLGKIAAAEYGKVSEYKAIFERNKDRLKNANTIYEGQVIILPAK